MHKYITYMKVECVRICDKKNCSLLNVWTMTLCAILPHTMITYNQWMSIHMKQCHMTIGMSLNQRKFISSAENKTSFIENIIFSRKTCDFNKTQLRIQVIFNMVWDGSFILSRINSNLKSYYEIFIDGFWFTTLRHPSCKSTGFEAWTKHSSLFEEVIMLC